MAVFVVIPLNGADQLSTKIATKFAERSLVAGSSWLISFDGTSRQLSEELGVDGEHKGVSALVIAAQSYWGRAPLDVWEWIKANWERSDGGS